MWWLLLVGAVIIYLVWTEIKSQDCLESRCINSTPPVTAKDPPKMAADKTIETLRKNHTIVGWRRAMLVAIAVTIPIAFFLLHQFPSGFDFFVITTIIFIVVYFSSVWLQARWWGMNDLKIERSLLVFRHAS
jgi:uncharacterized membrane-anchored protein